MPLEVHPKGFTLTDAATVPLTSPIAAGTSEVPLKCPASGTYNLVVYGKTNLLKVGRTMGFTTVYFEIPASVPFALPCRNGETLYFQRPSSTELHFAFVKFGEGS